MDSTTTSLSSGAIIVKDGGITAAKLATGVNGALFIGNGTGFTNTTLTAGAGIAVTNASGAITVSAASLGTLASGDTNDYVVNIDHSDSTCKTFKKSTAFINTNTGDLNIPLDRAFWCGYVDAAIQVKAPRFVSGANQVVGVRQAAVPDIVLSGTYSADYTILRDSMNDLLAKLRTHGLIAS